MSNNDINGIPLDFSEESVNEEATPFFSTDTTKQIRILFDARQKYKTVSIDRIIEYGKSLDSNLQIPFGDLYNENAFYGLLDLDNDIVLPKEEFIKSVKNNQNQQLIDFCAEAFSEMSKYFDIFSLKGKINSTVKYGQLNIVRSYNDASRFNIINNTGLAINFRNSILKNKLYNSQITNYKKFIEIYTRYYINASKRTPVTKIQNCSFYNFSTFTSGLLFSIYDSSAGDDIVKYKEFLLSDNFFIFADICKTFGFKIDKNMPWVLFADLSSPAMLGQTYDHVGYATRMGINNVKDLFEKRFYKVYTRELDDLKDAFYNAYQIFLSDGNEYYEIHDQKLCTFDIKNKNNILKRDNVSKQEFFSNYKDSYWIRLYLFIRNIETQKGLSQQQFENIAREAGEYADNGYVKEALKYINDYFKAPKDFSLYFSSLQKQGEMLKVDGNKVSNNTLIPNLIFQR